MLLVEYRTRWLIVVLLLVLSAAPLVQADQSVDVNFTLSQDTGTVYVTAWAQGAVSPAVLFQISIWYNAPGTHGFVSIFSGTVVVQSANGYASALVQAAIPGGGASNGHFFVKVQALDPSTGSLLGFAGYDPTAGGTNGGPGFN